MKAADILHRETQNREDNLRHAVLLGAGAALVGGTLWWAWTRTRPHRRQAPGRPGATPHWNFSSKDGVGTALGPDGRSESRVWFTIRHGAFTEIFYPRVDQPAIRDLGLVVTDGSGFFSDERWDADHEMRWLAEGVPGLRAGQHLPAGPISDREDGPRPSPPGRRPAAHPLRPLGGAAWMTTASSRS